MIAAELETLTIRRIAPQIGTCLPASVRLVFPDHINDKHLVWAPSRSVAKRTIPSQVIPASRTLGSPDAQQSRAAAGVQAPGVTGVARPVEGHGSSDRHREDYATGLLRLPRKRLPEVDCRRAGHVAAVQPLSTQDRAQRPPRDSMFWVCSGHRNLKNESASQVRTWARQQASWQTTGVVRCRSLPTRSRRDADTTAGQKFFVTSRPIRGEILV
ncbi:hypothetical protein MB901379_02421 [Mycobacterium basiliense]|uniref:Uncharacterized protein n=1 Tax=Mycobacterium basiliense TaxID=2094119 RepID=A0A3S4BEE8_9MYCO|nr:hypothetical protein MB901379_02421 [Mycobacterium basiliense]